MPDLIVRVDDGGAEPLNLIIEVTGEHRREKAAKVATRADATGSRPSTTTAAWAAGRSSRSPTRGTPRT